MLLSIDFYQLFYWITVADGVKGVFDVFSTLFCIFSIIFILITFILIGVRSSEDNSDEDMESLSKWITYFTKWSKLCIIIMVITWVGYVFIPSKKDALTIVAGGAVGNFITKDSSAKQIPSEVMTLLRDKIRSEIKEINSPSTSTIVDTLASKSKQELINIIKEEKK